MSVNRIQKLLFSEYSNFEDTVLVESPFAQTTRDGIGLRQIQLGLTNSKLIFATDILPAATKYNVTCLPAIDPDVESFELVAVFPIECVNLSVFRRHRRKSLKARFCNNKVFYFELGGFETRKMFWNLWCEKVKFLQPEDPDSSVSETSIATSTTNSTLYLLSSVNRRRKDGARQLWCQYGAEDCYIRPKRGKLNSNISKWTDKSLYIGKAFEEKAKEYIGICDLNENVIPKVNPEQKLNNREEIVDTNAHLKKDVSIGSWYKVNRFSKDVGDNCEAGLYLKAEDYTTISSSVFTFYKDPQLDAENTENSPCIEYSIIELIDKCVLLWEACSSIKDRGRSKHRRRYSFGAQSHFLHGLGPWNVSAGERYSVQRKRACSLVSIRRQSSDSELRLPVSKRQLLASISCEELYNNDNRLNITANTIKCPPKQPVVFFWTPAYWYRPRSSKDAYMELQTHLNKIRSYRQQKKKSKRLFRKRSTLIKITNNNSETEAEVEKKQSKPKRSGKFKRLKRKMLKRAQPVYDVERAPQETSLQYLKRILKLEMQISPWDFDSTTIAQQLTLIDRDLFLKIPASELGVLIWQQSSKNAPNIGALIAFSHRISCLVTTEILKQTTEKVRARLITRFINTADKCNKISNYQSCKSILSGLQSPAIYRLYSIWNYLRKKHATKYEVFQNLCKLYRDPRLPSYYRAFWKSSQYGASMPYVGDIIERLLDKVPDYRIRQVGIKDDNIDKKDKEVIAKDTTTITTTVLLRKLLSSLKPKAPESIAKEKKSKNLEFKIKQCDLVLDDFYLPLNVYTDNRGKCFEEGSKLLLQYQKAATLYIFSRNELAVDYLLKTRYYEDRENFSLSFKIETACIN